MTSKFQTMAIVAILIVFVLSVVFFTESNPRRVSHSNQNPKIMSRPSGVTPGDGEDFRPKW